MIHRLGEIAFMLRTKNVYDTIHATAMRIMLMRNDYLSHEGTRGIGWQNQVKGHY